MTPKEKADELVKKMYKVHSDSASSITLYFAKQCALIAVNEVILEQCKSSELKDPRYQDERLMYWNEVKQEIKKL
jgi:hypothetical protein